jgi:hypothetical protein
MKSNDSLRPDHFRLGFAAGIGHPAVKAFKIGACLSRHPDVLQIGHSPGCTRRCRDGVNLFKSLGSDVMRFSPPCLYIVLELA